MLQKVEVPSFDTYLENAEITQNQYATILRAIKNRDNLLVVGKTGAGKTTLINALLLELDKSGEGLILIENERTLYTENPNLICYTFAESHNYCLSNKQPNDSRIIADELRSHNGIDIVVAFHPYPGSIISVNAADAASGLKKLEALLIDKRNIGNENLKKLIHLLTSEIINYVIYIENDIRRIIKLYKIDSEAQGYQLIDVP